MTALFQRRDKKMHVRYLLLCLANNILRVNKSYCYHFNCCMITIYIDCYLGHLFLLLMSILRLRDRKILFFFFCILGSDVQFSKHSYYWSCITMGKILIQNMRTCETTEIQWRATKWSLGEATETLSHSGKLGHPLDVIYENWRYT